MINPDLICGIDRNGSNNHNWKGGGIDIVCANCGETFRAAICHHRIFCSQSCSVSDKNRKRIWKETSRGKISTANKGRLSGENNPNYQGGGVKLICIECKSEFELAKNELKKQRGYFCSIKCKNVYVSKNRIPDIQQRIHRNMRQSMLHYVRNKNHTRWEVLLGYSAKDLMNKLESQFSEGMSWSNYGKDGWEIDHVRPVSSFRFTSLHDPEFKECWNINNLQPLWRKDNQIKGGVRPYRKLKPITI